MNYKTVTVATLVFVFGCADTQETLVLEQATRIEELAVMNSRLTIELKGLEAQLAKVEDPVGNPGEDTPAEGAQIDEGTILIYDPDLASLSTCAQLDSENVVVTTKLTDLPVGVIITPDKYSKKPREVWILASLKGDCKRSYEIERASGKVGVLPDHFTGAAGHYDQQPPIADKHHRLTLHRVDSKPAVLATNEAGKYLVPKEGFDSMTHINFTGPGTTKNDDACTKWTGVLKAIWTDTGSNALWDSVTCYTTPASAPRCDPGGGNSCPDS